MNIKTPGKKELSQEEIDQRVIAQADDESAWDEPMYVHPMPPTSLSLPSELAARAAFIAHLHRKTNVEEWLMHIIQERLDIEETVYGTVKRELATGRSTKPKNRRLTATQN